MVTITDYTVLRTGKGDRAVTMKNLNCPYCNGKLRVRDSRRRKSFRLPGRGPDNLSVEKEKGGNIMNILEYRDGMFWYRWYILLMNNCTNGQRK